MAERLVDHIYCFEYSLAPLIDEVETTCLSQVLFVCFALTLPLRRSKRSSEQPTLLPYPQTAARPTTKKTFKKEVDDVLNYGNVILGEKPMRNQPSGLGLYGFLG